VRLVKRWLASHWLLGGHIREEVVEIICASFFAGDGLQSMEVDYAQVPGSKERGFANVVGFFKDWKWEDGLFVPLYGNTESLPETQKLGEISGCKSSVWTVSTEADKEGRLWTLNGPDMIIAHRVRALAKATWDHLESMEQENFSNVQVCG
jgi:U3 small nucleolar RNA-associated protein 22